MYQRLSKVCCCQYTNRCVLGTCSAQQAPSETATVTIHGHQAGTSLTGTFIHSHQAGTSLTGTFIHSHQAETSLTGTFRSGSTNNESHWPCFYPEVWVLAQPRCCHCQHVVARRGFLQQACSQVSRRDSPLPMALPASRAACTWCAAPAKQSFLWLSACIYLHCSP